MSSYSCVASLGQQAAQTSIQRVLEDSIAKFSSDIVDRLIEVLLPAISHTIPEYLGAPIKALTGSSLAPVPSLASEKCDPNLSPALSAPDLIVPEQHAELEDLAMECGTPTTKRRTDENSNTPSPSG